MNHSSLNLFVILLLGCNLAMAQEQNVPSQTPENLYSLSLEELMSIPIRSASKKDETLFEAPLSSYTITRNDIDRTGATSIMECLRLAPGLIVREQVNGEYDVHIRGMDNLTRTNAQILGANIYTLVMIDSRPVFNHGLGGTYWETLPVDIGDIERIEIVRGPSSPLFGPNAVTGVINIITKRMDDSSYLADVSIQSGVLTPFIGNATVGKRIYKGFNIVASANLQDRMRSSGRYYDAATGNFVDLSALVPDEANRKNMYPHPSRSLHKWGINTTVSYQSRNDVSVDLALSRQMASYQRYIINPVLTYGNTTTNAANLALKVKSLAIRSSYVNGYISDIRENIPHGEYDYKVIDANAEYEIKVASKYSFTPGVSFVRAIVDDRKYTDPANGIIGYFNSEKFINTTAAYVRADLNFSRKFRTIIAIRADAFSNPNKTYWAYEAASTYQINSSNMARIALTSSNSGSFLAYNYLDISGVQIGDPNLKIFNLKAIEIGYRSKVSDNFQLDLDVFRQRAENLSAFTFANGVLKFSNIPTTAIQYGATLSFNYVPNERLQLKPFITIQKTETSDFPSMYLDPSYGQSLGVPVSYSSDTHKSTPSYYGGMYLHYTPVNKLDLNVNAYYYDGHTQYNLSYNYRDRASNPAQYDQGQIDGKILFNAKLSCQVLNGFSVFAAAKNIFGSSSREFYGGDQTERILLAGLSYRMK